MNRRQIVRVCKQHGFMLQPSALKAMLESCGGNNSPKTAGHADVSTHCIEHMDDFMAVLQQLQRMNPRNASGSSSKMGLARGGPMIVTADLWKQALVELLDAAKTVSAATLSNNPDRTSHEELCRHQQHVHSNSRRDDRNVKDRRAAVSGESIKDDQIQLRHANNGNRRPTSSARAFADQTSRASNQHSLPPSSFDTAVAVKPPEAKQSESASAKLPVVVVSAFNMPRLTYDSLRQQFCYTAQPGRERKPASVLLGSAADKVGHVLQRYTLIHQRLMRHELFRASRSTQQPWRQRNFLPTDGSTREPENPSLTLTSIDRLLGTVAEATSGHQLVLLGMLRYNSDPTVNLKNVSSDDNPSLLLSQHPFVLEDPSGQVVLDMTMARSAVNRNSGRDDGAGHDASVVDGYVTEHSMVLVQGDYDSASAVFTVRHLGLPPAETLAQSRSVVPVAPYCSSSIVKSLINVSVDGGREPKLPPLQVYIVSQCHLDRPEVVAKIEEILGIIETKRCYHAAVCFMGNFSSTGSASRTTLSSSSSYANGSASSSASRGADGRSMSNHPLCDLAVVIAESYPFVAEHTELIFVPGPSDTSLPVLPQPALRPLPSSLLSGVRNWRMTSNPCRLAYGEQEIVLFRQGLTDILVQAQVLDLQNDRGLSQTESDVSEPSQPATLRMARTIVEQGHLVPVAPHQRPLFWNCDHALRLYPLPDAIVIGDATPYAHFVQGCPVLSPGTAAGSSAGTTDDSNDGYLHLTLRGYHPERHSRALRRSNSRPHKTAPDLSTTIRLYQNGVLMQSNASGVLRKRSKRLPRRPEDSAVAGVTGTDTDNRSSTGQAALCRSAEHLSTESTAGAAQASSASDGTKSSDEKPPQCQKPISDTPPEVESSASVDGVLGSSDMKTIEHEDDLHALRSDTTMPTKSQEQGDADVGTQTQATMGADKGLSTDQSKSPLQVSDAERAQDATSQDQPFSQISHAVFGTMISEDEETPADSDVLRAFGSDGLLSGRARETGGHLGSQGMDLDAAEADDIPFSQMTAAE